MTALELQAIQKKINFDGPSMALCMGVDYEHYRRLYYGTAAISDKEARAALELEKINTEFMAGLPARVDAHIPKGGIISQVEAWE